MGSEIVAFDYNQIANTTARVELRATANIIRHLLNRTTGDILEIGERLLQTKEELEHGMFMAWVKAEFPEIGYDTIGRLMNVAETFKFRTVRNLPIQQSALYLLAAPSAPEEAREEAVQRATAGETITKAAAQEIVAHHKYPAPQPPLTTPAPVQTGDPGFGGIGTMVRVEPKIRAIPGTANKPAPQAAPQPAPQPAAVEVELIDRTNTDGIDADECAMCEQLRDLCQDLLAELLAINHPKAPEFTERWRKLA